MRVKMCYIHVMFVCDVSECLFRQSKCLQRKGFFFFLYSTSSRQWILSGPAVLIVTTNTCSCNDCNIKSVTSFYNSLSNIFKWSLRFDSLTGCRLGDVTFMQVTEVTRAALTTKKYNYFFSFFFSENFAPYWCCHGDA